MRESGAREERGEREREREREREGERERERERERGKERERIVKGGGVRGAQVWCVELQSSTLQPIVRPLSLHRDKCFFRRCSCDIMLV